MQPVPPPAWRRFGGAALKAGVSLGLLALLFSRVDRGDMAAALRGASLPILLFCLPLYVIGQVFSTIRWQVLLHAGGIRVPIWRLLLVYLEGMFFNLFLPTAVGGDVVRGYRIWHLTRAGEGAVASILVERLTGFVAMVGIAAVAATAAFWSGTLRDPAIVGIVGTVAAGLAASIFLVATPATLRVVEGLTGGVRAARVLTAVARFCEGVQRYRGHGRALGLALLISVGFQTLVIFLVYLVAVALHLRVGFGQFLVFIPILNVISMLPISLGGLGLREGGAVFLLAKVGVEPASALTLSLLWFAIIAVTSLPGGLVFLWGGHAAKARRTPLVAE